MQSTHSSSRSVGRSLKYARTAALCRTCLQMDGRWHAHAHAHAHAGKPLGNDHYIPEHHSKEAPGACSMIMRIIIILTIIMIMITIII
jgi:transcriptional regulator of met regulon